MNDDYRSSPKACAWRVKGVNAKFCGARPWCCRFIPPRLKLIYAKVPRFMTKFDAIIIGTGQAGPSLARRLAAAGMTVAIVERGLFGGTCVNTGCIPTK